MFYILIKKKLLVSFLEKLIHGLISAISDIFKHILAHKCAVVERKSMEVKDGIYSQLTVFYYCKSISTSQSVCNQLIKKCLVQLKCTFWFETSVCLKIYICKNKKKGIIKCISYSFFVNTNNHFIFFPVYFFDQPEAQWEVFLQLSSKEGARIKRGGGLPSKP